jgi:hypothetical protein
VLASDRQARQLDTSQLRRLVGSLCLRPGERVLHLGCADVAAARLASYLVGPTGQVVEAACHAAAAGRLPFADGEFDAVFVSVVITDADLAGVLAQAARVTAPTGRVAFPVTPPAGGAPAQVYALAETAGLRGTSVRHLTGTGADAEPTCLVTAFPPPPTGLGTVSGSSDRTAAGPTRAITNNGPLLTLLAGLVLAAGLLPAVAIRVDGDTIALA